MTVFDLLFIGIFLTTLVLLGLAALNFLRRRPGQALRLLGAITGGLIIYLGVVVLVSLTSPSRVLSLGEKRCFDDWCISVEDIDRAEKPGGITYTVSLQISNRAQRISQRELGMTVYMLDEAGRHFEASADPAEVPFNSLLQPGQTLALARSFELSGTVGQPVLVVGHDASSWFPGMFIIGDDASLLHKPTIVRLP